MLRNIYILKTISLFLSFWMLFASAGLSIDFHFCDGKIVDWNISGSELICEHAKQEIEKSSCCKASHDVIGDKDKIPQIEDGCCDTGEAEMVISQDFDLNQTELDIAIPILFSYSFHLPVIQSENVKEICEQQKEFPSVSVLKKLASIQTFVI